MTSPSSPLVRFFETYERALEQPDPSATLPLFADTFLALGPDGAGAVPVAAFGPALAKRKQLFDQLGCRSTELLSLDETALDGRYSLARTSWRMTFQRPGYADEAVTVHSTFLVDTQSGRILVYLAHQDVFAILRERGVLSN